MTEKEVTLLGFEKEYGDDYYYYHYEIAKGLQFLSKPSDEDGDWYIEFFNTDPRIVIRNFAEAQKLINEIEMYVYKN
jgi:hypothetical protein